jgi:hypothetical protein
MVWGGGGHGKGALEHRTLPPLPPPRGRQWAASGQDTFGFMEALLKYVHRDGMFVYCARMLWNSKKSIKICSINQFCFYSGNGLTERRTARHLQKAVQRWKGVQLYTSITLVVERHFQNIHTHPARPYTRCVRKQMRRATQLENPSF